MTKTSTEVITEALRLIRVTAEDDSPTADQLAQGLTHMNALYAELDLGDDLALDWTVETVPDALHIHYSMAVAGSVCPSFNKNEYMPWREMGLDKIRAFEGRQLRHENAPIVANYF